MKESKTYMKLNIASQSSQDIQGSTPLRLYCKTQRTRFDGNSNIPPFPIGSIPWRTVYFSQTQNGMHFESGTWLDLMQATNPPAFGRSFPTRWGIRSMTRYSLAKVAGNPRFKSVVFGNSADDVNKMIIDLLSQRMAGETGIEAHENEQIPRDADKLSIWANFNKTVAASSRLPQGSFTSRAIQKYREDNILPRNKDPPLWWNEYKIIHPNLAKLAQKILCIVASSVPCEHFYSQTGMVTTDRRKRINEKKQI
ncbi:hypothetical protein J437_LFUL012678 [Ladona fulva]|uniref:HAT C-terminal dimerisation domain-containing protein n=1 Tax=Ladona fulva TaxID=123851 RepID=A0A8K0P488_LADFU|nr:hypothetical protein J437_LFUL012678 [Ladona fulva]